jgi:hypothetical protein
MKLPTTSTAPSTPTVQREDDATQADRIERHVDRIIDALAEPTPTEAFEALVAEHQLHVEEWDTSTLDEDLRDKFFALYIESRGRKIVAVPIGQDPAHRLAAVRALLAHFEVVA